MSIVINGMDMPKGNSTKNLLVYSDGRVFTGHKDDVNYFAEELQSAQQEVKTSVNGDWVILNKDKILKAGMEGREVDFRIGGRLFAIREKAQ